MNVQIADYKEATTCADLWSWEATDGTTCQYFDNDENKKYCAFYTNNDGITAQDACESCSCSFSNLQCFFFCRMKRSF